MGLKTSKKWPQASKRYNSTAAYPKDQLEFKFFFFRALYRLSDRVTIKNEKLCNIFRVDCAIS